MRVWNQHAFGGCEMLLDFTVTNHLSLEKTQTLSMVASSLKDIQGAILHSPAAPAAGVLPAVVIYGANASGKSNFISALRFFRKAISTSHRLGNAESGIPCSPFAFHPDIKASSTFTANFILNDVRYQYGFECDQDIFMKEWLLSFPNGTQRVLFNRDKQKFRFGRSLRGENRVISQLTRKNSLFLSAAVQNNHEELTKIAFYFETFAFNTETNVKSLSVAQRFSKTDIDPRVITFLNRIGTGIVSYKKTENAFPERVQAMQKDFAGVIAKYTNDEFSLPAEAHQQVSIELEHQAADGNRISLALERESSGTRRLLVMLGPIFKALDGGGVVIIDELGANLHTQVCEAILALFCSKETNPLGAQLVATTHDTNLLRSELLRRDQIWFAEKDSDGATEIYPLTDFKTRKGDNIEKGYVQGRYGAVPFSGDPLQTVDSE